MSIKKIAVLTSGGDAPGMNACIRAVVRAGIYNELEVCGVYRGYQGLIEGDFEAMDARSVSKIIYRGGTILKSARSDDFMTKEGRKKAHQKLVNEKVDALVAIGGDGTFKGADVFSGEFNFPIVGVPGTIDNDLAGTDFTIGFNTALNTALESIDKIRDTAAAHNRLFFVEVMGRDSGRIALWSGVAGGAEEILLPEEKTDIDELVEKLKEGKANRKSSSIVVVAEGDDMGGALKIAEMVKERMSDYETRVTILGHVQRGGNPTCYDRILASRLGVAAVESLVNNKSGVMVGLVNSNIKHTPLSKAIKNNKLLNEELLRVSKILSI
ncbi:MAG: 6-phosphofructokinase [Bacteroidia bacterium]|nr:6-phosphofructokinase [Bacteroidia bacterium]NNC86508.1 6-phosphofructokinase [Bacteroidia bacterium]NNM16840.1 6-phosphofructokinase [Bacteroidia bacterium]